MEGKGWNHINPINAWALSKLYNAELACDVILQNFTNYFAN